MQKQYKTTVLKALKAMNGSKLASRRRNNLIQQLRACSLPDFLDDSSQLRIGVINVALSFDVQ